MQSYGSIFIDDYVYRCAFDMAVQVHRIARVGTADKAQRAVVRRKIEDIELMRATGVFEKRFPALAAFEPYEGTTPTAAPF